MNARISRIDVYIKSYVSDDGYASYTTRIKATIVIGDRRVFTSAKVSSGSDDSPWSVSLASSIRDSVSICYRRLERTMKTTLPPLPSPKFWIQKEGKLEIIDILLAQPNCCPIGQI